MTNSSNGFIGMSGIIRKTLISITLTLSLMTSFVLSALPAQALPVSSNVNMNADFTKANQDIGNLENRILIAAGRGRSSKRSSSPSHRRRELRSVQIDSYQVDKSHLGKGTKTTKKTRKHVNNPKTFRPKRVEAYYKAGKKSGSTSFKNTPSKTNDAGHILGKQNGGKGNVPSQVFPQDPSNNRGINGKRGWRGAEDEFNKAVKKYGQGQWTVKQYR